jgi:hypothetical protein
VSAWLKRFGLHLAAAVGATGVFVVAAAVGANQTRQQADLGATPIATVVRPRQGLGQRPRPTVVVATPPAQAGAGTGAAPAAEATPEAQAQPLTPRQQRAATAVRPERSLAGTVQSVGPDSLQVLGVGGRTWTVEPAPGALVRLNGKAAKLEALQPGDGVVILGQAQPGQGQGLRFLAHAVTAKGK